MKFSLIVAIILTILYGILVAISNVGTETNAQRYLRKNQDVVVSYVSTKPQLVLAGSSLTAALKNSGFETCTYNLGLIGESPLTGLDVVIDRVWKPKMVFVEINFPEGDSNSNLIQRKESWLVKYLPNIIYVAPITNLVQNVVISLRRLRVETLSKDSIASTASGTEAETARQAELKIQQVFFEKKIENTHLKYKLVEFGMKIQKLLNNGVNVVLFEVPVHPSLEETPRAKQIREAFRVGFPDLRMVSAEMLSRGVSIKTADGLHLNDDDSSNVLKNFSPEFQAVCESLP